MKLPTILAAVISAAVLSACTTVTRGTNTAFEVQTTPAGAQVSTSNGYECSSTPCSIKMPRKSEFVATVSKSGYETIETAITGKVSNAGSVGMAGNVLVGGVIGAGVDLASGAMLDLTPNPLILDLDEAR